MSDTEAFERCLAEGGVAVFPSDTVYGLACDPLNRAAVERLYRLKVRALSKPSAVMFFELERAFEELPELGERTVAAMRRLLPGGVTLLVANPEHRFPLAGGDDPGTLGIRVSRVERLAELRRGVLQSSANLAGGPDPRRLEDVPERVLSAADLVIDGGELPGTSSTVVDLRGYEEGGLWSVLRSGAVGEDELERALGAQFHFLPSTYSEEIRAEVPGYERLQEELVAVSGDGAHRILELGTGTGETSRRLLARHQAASLVGIDESPGMLAAARESLPAERVDLRIRRLEDPLPDGPFDLVASALTVHHLDPEAKADLFKRVKAVLAPGGRFVLGDVVVPEDPPDARTPLSEGYDKPSPVSDQLPWLAEAGFRPRVVWSAADLVVIVGEA